MDDRTFDRVTRILADTGSRRAALRALLAATPLAILALDADAKKKKGKKNKKKKRNNQTPTPPPPPSPPPPPTNPCSGSQPHRCGDQCVNLQADDDHCGQCDNACPTGERCVNGNCSCGVGSIACEGACVPGDCCNGALGETCNSNETCCLGTGCKDLSSDEHNCGACGQASFAGEQCIDGLSVCPEGSIVCGDRCRSGNCCINGDATTCDEGYICCGNEGCRNTAEDPDHCGACGIVCSGTSDYCDNGRCVCKVEASGNACVGGEICYPEAGCACPPQLPRPGTCGDCNLDCPEGCEDGRCTCKDEQVFHEGACRDCPPPPGIVLPGPKCFDSHGEEYCRCGGKCCSGPGQCFVTENDSGEIVEEYCCDGDRQSICDDQCCETPTCNGSCPRQTARYISYRRPGR